MTKILKMKAIKKHKSSGAKRFKLNPTDIQEMIKDREVNSFLQMIKYPQISFYPDSGIGIGNIIEDSVTLK